MLGVFDINKVQMRNADRMRCSEIDLGTMSGAEETSFWQVRAKQRLMTANHCLDFTVHGLYQV